MITTTLYSACGNHKAVQVCGSGGCITDRNTTLHHISDRTYLCTNDYEYLITQTYNIYKYTKNMNETMQPNKRNSTKLPAPLTQHSSAHPAR